MCHENVLAGTVANSGYIPADGQKSTNTAQYSYRAPFDQSRIVKFHGKIGYGYASWYGPGNNFLTGVLTGPHLEAGVLHGSSHQK